MKENNDTASGSGKRYVRIKDMLKSIPVCERTFRDLIRLGQIPSYRVGRRRIVLVAEEVDRAFEARFRREARLPS
jgi:hypothetical protein